MAKGGAYEREVCRTLSLWWSRGRRDDLCWRTSNSGGRATVRHRKGKKTAGHAGDICATSEHMKPFFDKVTVECKRGYNTTSILDLVDNSKGSGKKFFGSFVKQAKAAAKRAGTKYWIIIHRRDKREAIVYADSYFWKTAIGPIEGPALSIIIPPINYVGMLFSDFVKKANPKVFQQC